MNPLHPSDNPYLALRLLTRPDTGEESYDFSTLTVFNRGEECVQLRIRPHRDGYSPGYYVNTPPHGALNVYPTCETGIFREDREACLYALSEILIKVGDRLTPPARRAVKQAVARFGQRSLF